MGLPKSSPRDGEQARKPLGTCSLHRRDAAGLWLLERSSRSTPSLPWRDDDESLELHSHITAVLRRYLALTAYRVQVAQAAFGLHEPLHRLVAVGSGSRPSGSVVPPVQRAPFRLSSPCSSFLSWHTRSRKIGTCEGSFPFQEVCQGRGDAMGDMAAGPAEADEVHPNEETAHAPC